MRNIVLVAWREYVENARTKGFWIGIFMLPLILFLSVQVPMLLERRGAPARYFVLADETGQFEAAIMDALGNQHQTQAAQARQSGAPEPRRIYRRVDWAAGDGLEALALELRPFLRGEKLVPFEGGQVKLDAAILIPRGISAASTNPGIQYWSANLADKALLGIAGPAVNQELKRREYLARGLDAGLYREIERLRLPIVELDPRKEQGQEKVSRAEAIAQWAPVGFVYLLWVALFSISQMLLGSTIEEKSNRIIEVLLSSLTPAEFVLGKLAGIAAVGLTMVGAWLLSMFAVMSWTAGGQSELGVQFLAILKSSSLLPAFVVYFFFGYLLYAGIILSIGSVCNTLKEAQNYMAVVTLLMMVPLMTMVFITKDPHGPLARLLSWIPIYTPFVMMNRAAAGPPLWELLGTMLLLAGSTAAVLWAGIRIFHRGILRSGQPPRLLELLRWLRPD